MNDVKHIFFQAIAMEGHETNIVTDYVLKVNCKKERCVVSWKQAIYGSNETFNIFTDAWT